jgi:hypothetical protein
MRQGGHFGCAKVATIHAPCRPFSMRICNCLWCSQPAINSHLIPKSILKAAIKQKRVEALRALSSPNLVEQDISKEPILCHSHDGGFSTIENRFLTQIYNPALSGATPAPYGEWLLKFAIFLSWKILVNRLQEPHNFDPKAVKQAHLALKSWQSYLRYKRHKALYSHHVVFTDRLIPQGLTSDACEFYRGAFECLVLPTTEGGLTVWATMPGCVIISATYKSAMFEMWPTTKISKTGRISFQVAPQLIDHLNRWADQSMKDMMDAVSGISERQRQKIISP